MPTRDSYMSEKVQKLNDSATVKGTMLLAHLAWASERFSDVPKALAPLVDSSAVSLLQGGVLPTQWFPFKRLIEIDSAIAKITGGEPDATYQALGRHSARLNLEGAYKVFVSAEPHRFFEKSALLHDRFQNFGRMVYERLAERSGRVRMENYPVYSPVYCAEAQGYYGEALSLMRVPGPIRVEESLCCCSGDAACVFELAW